MPQKLRYKKTSVSLVNYHFVWIVRRRKKVLIGHIKQRLEQLIHDAAREVDCEVFGLAIEPDYVHLFVNSHPDIAPSQIMHKIKGTSARYLRQEFADPLMKLPSMWTRSYFCGTAGNVGISTIKEYVEAQRKH